MNVLRKIIALSTLAITLTSGLATAQEHGRYVRHREWRRGARIRQEDWRRGAPVDYRRYRLRRPPRGYEWREVDGNYVMAAVATGIIASAIIASSTGR